MLGSFDLWCFVLIRRYGGTASYTGTGVADGGEVRLQGCLEVACVAHSERQETNTTVSCACDKGYNDAISPVSWDSDNGAWEGSCIENRCAPLSFSKCVPQRP